MKLNRIIQFITGVHRIHDIHRGNGYKLPFCLICRFDKIYPAPSPSLRWYERHWGRTNKYLYHDCTITGIY